MSQSDNLVTFSSSRIEPFYLTLLPFYTHSTTTSNRTLLHSVPYIADVYTKPTSSKDLNSLDPYEFRLANLDQFETDPDLALDTLFWYQYPTISSFFLMQRIDIPLCFRKAKSLYTSTMVTPQVRLVTMLMNSGRKAYVLKHYSTALSKLLNTGHTTSTPESGHLQWRSYYKILAQVKFLPTHSASSKYLYAQRFNSLNMIDEYQQSYTDSSYEAKSTLRAQSYLYREWFKFLPLFNFYVKKVDKLKRKHSRGKSGKYAINWKYVPKYRRFVTVLRWFVKDVKFQKSRTFDQRLLKSLEILLYDSSSSLVHKFRQFVHTYVFQNHKKTLLKTLRSVS
jgi:hypothetical protein